MCFSQIYWHLEQSLKIHTGHPILIQAKKSQKSVWQNSGKAKPWEAVRTIGLGSTIVLWKTSPKQFQQKYSSAQRENCPIPDGHCLNWLQQNSHDSWTTSAQILPEVVFTFLSLDLYKDIDFKIGEGSLLS